MSKKWLLHPVTHVLLHSLHVPLLGLRKAAERLVREPVPVDDKSGYMPAAFLAIVAQLRNATCWQFWGSSFLCARLTPVLCMYNSVAVALVYFAINT